MYLNYLRNFFVANVLFSAANVMYECCERLSSELSGLSALQKKAKCYLACIHALECVPKQSAWISPPAYDSEVTIDRYDIHVSYSLPLLLHQAHIIQTLKPGDP